MHKTQRIFSAILTVVILITAILSTGITAFATMLPIAEVEAHLALYGYTNTQLSKMSVDSLLGKMLDSNGNTIKIDSSATTVWQYIKDEQDGLEVYEAFKLNSGATMDISQSEDTEAFELELIVGKYGQLNPDNVRYIIKVYLVQNYQEEFSFNIYTDDSSDNRVAVEPDDTEIARFESNIQDMNGNAFMGYGYAYMVPQGEYNGIFIEMESLLEKRPEIDVLVYDLADNDADGNLGAPINDSILNQDMTDSSAGYPLRNIDSGVGATFLVMYYLNGELLDAEVVIVAITGGLVSVDGGIFDANNNNIVYSASQDVDLNTAVAIWEYVLDDGYPADREYYLNLSVHNAGTDLSSTVKKAVVGHYTDIADTEYLTDIKDLLFSATTGYKDNFSGDGVAITLFFEDGTLLASNYYQLVIKAIDYEDIWFEFTDKPIVGQQDPWFRVVGVADKNGNTYDDFYVIENGGTMNMDTYYGYGYQTVFINDANADLSKLSPVFWYADTDRVYAVSADTGAPVEENHIRDFTEENQQYTGAIYDNKTYNDKNYWITFKKLNNNGAELFVYGPDEREVILDDYFEYKHDILIANIGNAPLEDITVELVDAENVKLDPYWTVGNNNNTLSAFDTAEKTSAYGELSNMAKIRLISDGNGEVKGTLIIRAKNQDPVMITLNGTAQTPEIITESVDEAVKYVPYSQIIATNNIHDWIDTKYTVISGSLPAGITLNKETGELYGVPTVPGEGVAEKTYNFTVKVEYLIDGQGGYFEPATKSYSLKVKANTDENVYNASDENYLIKQHIGTRLENGYGYVLDILDDTVFTSHGEYDNFVGLWLNGIKLEPGVDYTYVEGSTRIILSRQTFTNSSYVNTSNTIAAEFRENGGDPKSELKRTAQNFVLDLETESTKVIEQIDDLPGESKLTLSDKSAVQAARKAYDALNSNQKERVTNLSVLEAAEAKIADLEAKKAQEEKDKAAADGVISKIDSIPSNVSLDDKSTVEAARKAYDALTNSQKKLVTNYSDLTSAEDEIEELENTVIYDLPDEVEIKTDDAFEGATEVKVIEVAKANVNELIAEMFGEYTAYKFTATRYGETVQPSETLKVNFEIPEGYSNNVMVCRINSNGVMEEITDTIDLKNNTVSAEIDRLDTYIIVDIDSQIINEALSGNGDINANGEIDSLDYILLKRAYFGTFRLTEAARKNGDINGNGAIDSLDYILLKRAYFGTYKIN